MVLLIHRMQRGSKRKSDFYISSTAGGRWTTSSSKTTGKQTTATMGDFD
jgi:hypothetical protein